MKKFMAFVLASLCALALCSCGRNSQKAVAAVFSETVTKVHITHCTGSETANWSIEGAEIALLKAWFDNLDYRLIQPQDGQASDDGTEVYTFEFVGGEWLGFSYIINGADDCYLLNPEGNWFAVMNPSAPPISEPNR